MRRISPPSLAGLVFLASGLTLLAGCSGQMTGKVSGTVSLDEKPLTTGTVSFHPAGGSGAVAYGTVSDKGEFTITTGAALGIVPGEYLVTVVATEPPPPAVGNAAPLPPQLITPERYGNPATTDLKAEVKPGKNIVALKLLSSPATP